MKAFCTGPESVPLELSGSRDFVKVVIPGTTEPLRFHVDTGGNTPGVMLLSSKARQLGFVSVEDLPRTLKIGERRVDFPDGANWYLFDDESPRARASPTSGYHLRKDYSVGQLGAGFLSRFLVCLDPEHQRLALGTPDTQVDVTQTASVALMLQPGGRDRALYPFISASLRDGHAAGDAGQPIGLLLDSGATTSMLEASALEGLLEAQPDVPHAEIAAGDADMIGSAFDETLVALNSIQLNTLESTRKRLELPALPAVDAGSGLFVSRNNGTFRSMFGELRDAPLQGAIANDVLHRFRLLIDYRASRLYLERVSRAPEASESMTRVGLSLRFGDDGCPVIAGVTSSNARQTLELVKRSDVLLAVDGADTCKLYHHQIQAALAGSAGELRQLRLRRGETQLEVAVPTADLLVR